MQENVEQPEQAQPPVPEPQPDNTCIEQPDGWYFPAWGIHVAKTATRVDRKLIPSVNEQGHEVFEEQFEEVPVPVAQSVEEAKAHIKEFHGKDVDVDIPPPKPEEQDAAN